MDLFVFLSIFFFYSYADHRDLHSFPTRRSSDLHWRSKPEFLEIRVAMPKATATYLAGLERSEEHTSELQSRLHLVCRLLLEKKKNSIDVSKKYYEEN